LEEPIVELVTITMVKVWYLDLDAWVSSNCLVLVIRCKGHIVIVRHLEGVQNVEILLDLLVGSRGCLKQEHDGKGGSVEQKVTSVEIVKRYYSRYNLG